MRMRGFTLIELLVVIALIAILAAILFPVFAQAKEAAKKTTCLSQMKQMSAAWLMYLADNDDIFPDRRDLKTSLGYRPWTTWPPSDPRSGWASVLLHVYLRTPHIWECPSTASRFGNAIQIFQNAGLSNTNYWMWRFDRIDDPVPLDNFWGKSPETCVADLIASGNTTVGTPTGVADVVIVWDPYFPKTIPTTPETLRGKAVHAGGYNQLFLDFHAKFKRDHRTQ